MTGHVRTGQVLGALVVLFMIFDGVIHLVKIAPVVDAFAELGYPLSVAVPLGLIELACVAAYVVKPTRLIGALLLTAYFGGAIASQVRIGAPAFPVLFPVGLGVLLWASIGLRDTRVRALVGRT